MEVAYRVGMTAEDLERELAEAWEESFRPSLTSSEPVQYAKPGDPEWKETEPRDADGKWTTGGGGGAAVADESPAETYRRLGTRAPKFKSWFGDWEDESAESSKVVDAKGRPQEQCPTHSVVERDGVPVAVYHGTAVGGFDTFDPKKVDPDALYGPGFYFTEDESIAREYMAGGTGGHYQRIEIPAENRAAMLADYEAAMKAKGEPLVPEAANYTWDKAKATFKAYGLLAWLGSNVIGGPQMTYASSIADKYGAVTKLPGKRTDEAEKRVPVELKKVYLNIRRPFDADKVMPLFPLELEIGKHLKGAKRQAALDALSARATQLEDGTEGIKGGYAYRALASADGFTKRAVNKLLVSMGYDGITHTGGSMMGRGEHPHKVWIAFEPNQVKGVQNNGEFSPDDDRIDYARPGDPQRYAYDPSEPRDASGEWTTGGGTATLEKHDPTTDQRIDHSRSLAGCLRYMKQHGLA